ncbi:nucleotide excision repair TFIIH subunit [Martensiomyces pterosporus]|nr:nucleotide excision repair TFIIH subunit [Martensiomyces pterosporus]
MVKAVKGTLIECDQAAREVLLKLNSTDKFIIEDLDSTHLFINSTHLERIREALDELMNENTYKIETLT